MKSAWKKRWIDLPNISQLFQFFLHFPGSNLEVKTCWSMYFNPYIKHDSETKNWTRFLLLKPPPSGVWSLMGIEVVFCVICPEQFRILGKALIILQVSWQRSRREGKDWESAGSVWEPHRKYRTSYKKQGMPLTYPSTTLNFILFWRFWSGLVVFRSHLLVKLDHFPR